MTEVNSVHLIYQNRGPRVRRSHYPMHAVIYIYIYWTAPSLAPCLQPAPNVVHSLGGGEGSSPSKNLAIQCCWPEAVSIRTDKFQPSKPPALKCVQTVRIHTYQHDRQKRQPPPSIRRKSLMVFHTFSGKTLL